jgi:HEAT repeat protein
VAARFAALLESERLSVRFSAARALAHLGDPRGMPLLVRALDREDRAFRAALLAERAIDLDSLEPEIETLLSLLTGRSFGADYGAWRTWMDEQRGGAQAAARAEGGS